MALQEDFESPAKVPLRGFLASLDTCQHSDHGLAKHKAHLSDEAPWSASAFAPYESWAVISRFKSQHRLLQPATPRPAF